MAFTDDEKVKIRHHLGYLGVAEAQTFVLGIPAGVQTQFMVEGAMDKVLAYSEKMARRLISTLDQIEVQLVDDLELLAVKKIGTIEINPDELDKVKREYLHWRAALANLLGIIPNPFDQRFNGTGGGGINIPVQH